MRYYLIQVLNDDGSVFKFQGQPLQWTSWDVTNNRAIMGAQKIDFDVFVSTLATPAGDTASTVTVWGVPLPLISQAANLNGKSIKVYGGLYPGLPLATAAYNAGQSGLLVQGAIRQCYGNWVGTNMYLKFVITANGGNVGKQLNVSFKWPKNTGLSQPLFNCLSTALPGWKVDVSRISDNLRLPADELGIYHNLTQFAQYLKDRTQPLLSTTATGSSYTGVELIIDQKSIIAWDGSSPTSPKSIDFNDLIGQPTWLGPQLIQVTTSLRADLNPTDYIRLPNTQITVAPQDPNIALSDQSVFKGSFVITGMHHMGDSREPSALGWVTVMDCAPTGATGTS